MNGMQHNPTTTRFISRFIVVVINCRAAIGVHYIFPQLIKGGIISYITPTMKPNIEQKDINVKYTRSFKKLTEKLLCPNDLELYADF